MKDMQSKYIGNMVEHLKTLRTSTGLTQEQFGAKLGVSRQTVSSTESKHCALIWSLYLAMVIVFQHISIYT